MQKKKIRHREIRHIRLRKKLSGDSKKPRLCVYRSLSNISAQLIDDEVGKTLLSVSSFDKALKGSMKYGGNVKAAEALGALIANKALEKGISSVVFDRGGFLYHGRIKAFAESARKAGLKF